MLAQIEINKVLLANQNMLLWAVQVLVADARSFPSELPGGLQVQLERSQELLLALQAE